MLSESGVNIYHQRLRSQRPGHRVVNKLPEVIKQNVIWCSLAVTDLRVTHLFFSVSLLHVVQWVLVSLAVDARQTHTHIFRWCFVQPFTLHSHT